MPVGVCALVCTDARCTLEHFWVEPAHHGRGVGRTLFAHAVRVARSRGAARIRIVSDPFAEGFYLRLGAERVGIESVLPAGRELPVLEFVIPAAGAR